MYDFFVCFVISPPPRYTLTVIPRSAETHATVELPPWAHRPRRPVWDTCAGRGFDKGVKATMRTLAVTVLLALVAITSLVAAEKVGGGVVDQTGLPLPGVGLELRRAGEIIEVSTTAADGTFELSSGVVGDTVRATLDAFEPTVTPAGPAMRIVMALAHATETT